jgi:Domain of unknown function (DUF4111)
LSHFVLWECRRVTTAPPHEVATYAGTLAESIATGSGGRLVGACLHGSAAMGGWLAARSDVDVLFVLQDATPASALLAVEHTLVSNAPACPGTGLEASVVSVQQARVPQSPWPFLLHVAWSPGQEVTSVRGDASVGDPDLLMHFAVCRAAGVTVFGPDPMDVFGAVSRSAILAYLADELDWGLEHGSEAYAVLNACRALVFADHGTLVSKLSGGRTARDDRLGPPDVIGRALEEQQAKRPPAAIAADAAAFVRLVADRLRAEDSQGSRAR